MSELQKALASGAFAVTAEMAPPKGFGFSEQMEAAGLLRGGFHLLGEIAALGGSHFGGDGKNAGF